MKPIETMRNQAGIMLLEAMIAILIFSFGILAVVGMQAHAMQDMGQAKYRSDAAFLANQLVADIWTNAKNAPSYQWNAGSGTTTAPPTSLTNWVAQVNELLPGSDVHSPSVAYDAASRQVTITLRWLTPAEAGENPSMAPHTFVAVTYINTNG